MIYFCNRFHSTPFSTHIRFFLKSGDDSLLCIIRGKLILVTPEEMVRQSLLSFLTTQCDEIYPQEIDVKVENQSLDIAIYNVAKDDDFCPSLLILIIETKRKGAELDNYKYQLQRYLKVHNCEIGVLFNCDSILSLYRTGSIFQKKRLTDLLDLKELIHKRIKTTNDLLSNHQNIFDKAKSGCYLSFRRLAKVYGDNLKIKFIYEKNKIPILVSGFLFKFKKNTIYFRIRGIYTRTSQEFTEDQFRKIVSIRPL